MKLKLIVLSCVLIILTGCGNDTKDKGRVEIISTHPSFVTRQELNSILAKSIEKLTSIEGRVVSAVMPHHLLAGHLIAEALEILVPQQPEVVIIIGPNHFNRGGKVITGLYGWQTPLGTVSPEVDIVSFLLEKGLAVRDEEALSNEHSVGAIVPLLKYYLPQTKIVPIILHYDVSLKEVDTLLQMLEPFLEIGRAHV